MPCREDDPRGGRCGQGSGGSEPLLPTRGGDETFPVAHAWGPPAGTGTTGGGGDGVGGGQGVSSSWRVGVTEAADREGEGETLQARLVGEGCRGFPAAVVFLTV